MRPSSAHRSGLVAGMLIVGLIAGLFGNLEPARAAGSVIYVVPGGTGDGTSWANGRDLQAALTAAVAPAELWVKAGTYTSGAERTATFALKNGVAIYGGFAGTETALSEREVAANVTTLNGEIGVAGTGDNSYHVVTGSGTDATAILDGFSITGGNADGIEFTDSGGGGIFNGGGSATLANLTISGNTADFGGGLFNLRSSPVLTNVTISHNTSTQGQGGGLFNDLSSPVLTNVTILSNRAPGELTAGGGMFNIDSNPVLTNVTIIGNSAESGGGMFNDYSNPVLTNVTISANHADDGGGLYNLFSDPVVRNSIVWDNSDNHEIFNSISTPDVQYSLVEGGYPGTGNLNADPRFLNSGVLHLQAGSPAINAGSNAALPPGLITDLDGNPRIVDTTVDMGAYERQGDATRATSTTLTSSPNPSTAGESVTFSATVTSSGSTPLGRVSFRRLGGDGYVILGTSLLTRSGGATFSTAALSAGTYTIVAAYEGDATHLGSQSQVVQVVQVVTSNLLRNPGFELDANSDYRPDGWSMHPNVFRHAAAKRTGSYGMLHYTTADTTYAVYQAVPTLQGGTTYTFSGQVYALPAANDTFGFTLAVQWRNSSNAALRTDVVKSYTAATGGWNLAEKQMVAPEGTSYALVVLVAQSLKGAVAVDDFVLRP